MPRYIDADVFEVFTYTETEGVPNTFDAGVQFVLEKMDKIPTADVEPVVHAHWIKERPHNGRTQQYYCSACRQYGVWDDNSGTILTRYCPNCPAKMDEKVEQ